MAAARRLVLAVTASRPFLSGIAPPVCEQAQGLEAAQKQLAALVPEFAPYVGAIRIDADCSSAAKALENTAQSPQPEAATEGVAGN